MHPRPASRVRILVARPVPLVLLALGLGALLLLAWGWIARAPGSRLHAEAPRPAAPATPLSADVAARTWVVPTPATPAPEAPARAAASPDWSALSAGIAAIEPPAARPGAPPAPIQLAVDLSPRERRALIAASRDDGGLPSPAGYRPAIAVVVAGGGGGDGICR